MSVLASILERKQMEVAELRTLGVDLRSAARDMPQCRGFARALASSFRVPSLLAEVKSASPSQGSIRSDFDPVDVAKVYESVGASAVSVLTDGPSFGGSIEHLKAVRSCVELPLLRKEFIIDPLQIYEARLAGADAVLLIVAALTRDQLLELRGVAKEVGLDVLVEIHDDSELESAIESESEMLGVNNRNLATLDCDLSVSERLLPQIPDRFHKVAESGISSLADVNRMKECGARSLLIGTAFCKSPDIGAAVNEIMGWGD